MDPLFKENATKRAAPDETQHHERVVVAGGSGRGAVPVAIHVPTWLVELPAYQEWAATAVTAAVLARDSPLGGGGDVVYQRSIRGLQGDKEEDEEEGGEVKGEDGGGGGLQVPVSRK